jgi:hypothetical protein
MKKDGTGDGKGSPPHGGAAREKTGRFSARRKREAVERLVRGEDLELVSRELGVTAAALSQWREKTARATEAALKSREPDEADEEIMRLKAKIGDLTMANELLYEKIHRMEDTHPFPWRRSKR